MIEGVGKATPLRPGAIRVRQGDRSFAVSSETAGTVGVGDIASLTLTGMLAMQEAEADAASDREARRHGENLLGELARLQHDLLGDGVSTAGLARLADLAAQTSSAGSKELRGVLDAIGLRARVELARYGGDAGQSRG